ncbi:MAG: hypothetical protein C5B47_03220 [Verrucomicrobia bacterium]|nr:MAG: hypothetical protein C5B47_03220 [Verrucomicrobiota bacterium]
MTATLWVFFPQSLLRKQVHIMDMALLLRRARRKNTLQICDQFIGFRYNATESARDIPPQTTTSVAKLDESRS